MFMLTPVVCIYQRKCDRGAETGARHDLHSHLHITAGPNIVDLLYLAGHFILSLNLTFKQKLKRYHNKKSAVAERPRDA